MPSASSAPTLPFLERLLDGEKVEWKTLGEVFHTRNGYTPSKTNDDFWEGGTIPWFRMDDIRASGRILNDSTLHITPQAVKKNGLFKANSIILATSATVGEHAFLQQDSLANQRFTNFEIRDSLKEQLLPKFVFYYFFLVDEWCKQHLVIGNFPSVDVQQLISIPFPIPPLRVQSRIVEILDKFTQLEAELEDELAKELEARKKQYDFYRNRLLDFALRDDLKGQVEWKTLGEVAEYVRQRVAVDQLCAQTYVGVDNLLPNRAGKQDSNYLPTEGNAIAYQPNDILIGNIRPYLKKIWKADNEGGASADVLVVRITNSLLTPGYLYHLLADDRFFSYDMQHAKGAKMPRGNKEKILDYVLPLPPLSEQRRIVDILDRFDTLTNSISEGLPREIALRRKQYEYYRDALLRFPQPTPTA